MRQRQVEMLESEVTEVRVEPMILARQEALARKSNKMLHWLRLMGMHRDNNAPHQIDRILTTHLHDHFIMTEAFWEDYAQAKTRQGCTRPHLQLMLMALDDGPFLAPATQIALSLFALHSAKQVKLNFCLSVFERLLAMFDHDRKNGSRFHKILRSLYIEGGDQAKIRQSYEREIRGAFNDFDLVYHEYEQWEKDPQMKQGNRGLYEQANERWEEESVEFDQHFTSFSSLRAIRRSLFNLENENRSQVHREKYMPLLERLPTEQEKLWFLRRMAISYKGQWMNDYLQKVEVYHQEDEELIIAKFKAAITICPDQPSIEKSYLRYLVRRINPRLRDHHLPPEYEQLFGERVTHFRLEITELISKERKAMLPEDRKKLVMGYWDLWLQVEERIIEDKTMVCQLYENLLSQDGNMEYYEKYAESLINLKAVNEAKNVLRRYITHQKGWRSREKYKQFIEFYGNWEESQAYEEDEKRFLTGMVQSAHLDALETPVNEPVSKEVEIVHQNGKEKVEQPPSPLDPGKRAGSFKDEVESRIEKAARKKLHLDGENTLFIRGIPTDWKESDVLAILVNAQKVTRVSLVIKEEEQKDYCYVEFDSPDTVEDELHTNKSGYFMKMSRPPADHDESKSIFLCALPRSTTQQNIRAVIGQHAEHITDVRLIINRDKNIAYVDFDTQEHKDEAFEEVRKSDPAISGKKIIIQHCDSSRQKNKKLMPIVFLKRLPFKARQEDIRRFFRGKEISQLSLPTEPGGKPKGFGYVEFARFKDYQEALDMRRGELFGREFEILKSDRPITLTGSKERNHEPNRNNRQDRHKPKPKRNEEEKRDNNFFRNLMQ